MNDDDENNSVLQIIAIGVLIGAFFIGLAIADAKAEEYDMKKDCYLNMSQEQSLVCIKSMRKAVEKMAKQTKQLLANMKPVNAES